MKARFIFVLLLLSAASSKLLAQDFQGIAEYKTKRAVDIRVDSTSVNDEMMKQLTAELEKHSQRDYTLKFNRNESLYTENEKLETPTARSGGVTIKISSSSSILYKNSATGTYLRQQELMGKTFLVKDSLEKPDWKLSSETKVIGNYTCYKATWTREVQEKLFSSQNDEPETTTKETVTTAWYTPQISVSQGPGDYWGLPGLVLEIQEDKFSLLCTEITINPKDKFNLEAPKKGEVISQEEFKKIQEEKSREMMERYGSGRKGGGNVFSIKTGS